MKQEIKSEHRVDANGKPAGGRTRGVGIDINWQNGPLGRGADRKESNGAFIEGVIAAARDRLAWYQSSGFACPENAMAIQALDMALDALDQRTREREIRGVEGTYAA